MKRPPNPKIFMFLSIAVLLLGAVAIYFQYGSMTEVSAKVQKLQREKKDESQLNAQLESSKAKLAETSAKLNHLEQGVPEMAYVPTLLKELEAIGKDNGLIVLGVRPLPQQTRPKDKGASDHVVRKPYNELDIEVRCRGSYRSVMNFANALQTFPKIVAARTVSLSPKQDFQNPGAPQLDVVVELRSFLFPTKPAARNDGSQVSAKMEENGRNG